MKRLANAAVFLDEAILDGNVNAADDITISLALILSVDVSAAAQDGPGKAIRV